MSRSRIRVEGVPARWVGGIAVLAGVVAATAGASPTGSGVVDVVMVVMATAACVWAGSSAPWWSLVMVAGLAAALAPSLLLAIVAVAAGLGALAIGRAQQPLTWGRALVVGWIVQVLSRLGNVDRFGLSAALAISLLLTIGVAGVIRRPRRDRRVMWAVLGGVAVATVAALLGVGIAAAAARPDLEEGVDAARAGIDQLGDGDLDAARVSFARAADLFAQANSDLGRPWAQPARALPVVAQHRNAATRLVKAASDVSTTASEVLSVVDYDSLRVVNGSIDIAAVEALDAPLTRLDARLDSLTEVLTDIDGPWLVDRLRTELSDVRADIVREQVQGDKAIAAVRLAPDLLGADGKRVYFIAFTTPVEARGLGGFMGNWAEVTITDGHIEVTRFGRTADLNEGGDVAARHLDGPDEFLERYGKFGFREADGGVKNQVWSDITMSPDFPTVANLIAQLYPQSGGQKLDGVFAMDVYTVAALMQITGPVELNSKDSTVTAANAPEFLLNGQYVAIADRDQRIDMLEEVALTTVRRLLTMQLPAPPDLVELLSPFSAQGRLNAWAQRANEQSLFELVNMAGELPKADGVDGFGLTINNTGNNKIDYYLDGQATYDTRIDRERGTVSGQLDIELKNGAPSFGLPPIVINNSLGLPPGTNSMYLSIYTVLPVVAATIDGKPIALEVSRERGFLVWSAQLAIPPQDRVHLQLMMSGDLQRQSGDPRVLVQPRGVKPFKVSVSTWVG